jgi:TctA family transporter
MTTFEIIVLILYWAFATVYMAKTMGIEEENNCLLGVLMFLLSTTIGLLWFPSTFAFDIYDKLHE